MAYVEKRRSGRKSGGHRRHSDGGYSDTSSGGSFLDENDREVCSLTDRAFRSLCIGDEAVYNDSDLGLSSPCTQKDRQLAFSQSGQDRDREYREREELKRAAHENFNLKVQQYEQDWIRGRRYGGEIHRDPRWEVYGERAQGRISATFQHSVVETSEQEKSLREELNFLSNGATELSSQQRRSRSRVSSLIRAFNSEGHRDGVGMDDKLREWSDETSWDKSALMSIQRELSEFSTSYQQSFHSGHFPSSGPFSYRDTNLCSSGSDVAAASHSSFMRSSQHKHSIFTQVNCNSNVFIHSEFSPFKVWRDHNRFPFQQGQVSGFMNCSEFPKWYETPMYKEPSQMGQLQGYYTGIRQPRSNLVPMISPALPRSTSASTMLHNASAVEKRCESELAGHYPHRKRTQSLGTNKLPSHRPSTASPTSEMSRRVRDTISSVKALQQKIKMITEQNITTGVIENQQALLCSNESLGNNARTVMPNTVSSNTSMTPFNVSQMLTSLVHAHPEAVSSDFQHCAVSPQPVEHPPVRAESRGATPDIRMSTYKSRATSLLFNLKDNRKRVKSTYSPTKFKAAETPEKNKQAPIQEPRETAIEIPSFPDSEIQFSQLEESSRTSAAINQYRSPELSLTMSNSQPVMATTTTGQYTAYSLSDYQTAQMQGQMVHHSGFTGFLPENYIGNKLANGQNLHEDLASFAPYKQDTMADAGILGRDLYTHNPLYSATEAPRLNADNNQSGEYLISKPNTEQPFNETVGRLFTKVEKCEQLKQNKHDYNNVSLQDKRRQINSQDIEKLGMKATLSPWKQETAALMEKAAQENHQAIDQELEKVEMRESFAFHPSDKKPSLVNSNISNQPLSNDTVGNPTYCEHQRPLAVKDKNVLQKDVGYNEETELKDTHFKQNYNKHNDNEYISNQTFSSIKDKPIDRGGHEVHNVQPIEAKPQSDHHIHKNLFNPDNTSVPQMAKQMTDRQFVEPVVAEHIKSRHTQAEVAKVQQWAQVEQPEAESSRLILAGLNDSEKVATEQAQAQAAHIKGEKIKGEQTRQFREKQPELAGQEQTKAEQTRLHEARDEPRNITEEAGAEHIKKEQGKQVKAEQAEAEKLKEEHIKTELGKTEQAWQARIEEAKTEQATEKRINAAQIQEAQVTTEVQKEQAEAEESGTEKVNAKQAGAGKMNAKQVKEQQTEEKEGRTKAAEVKVQTDHIIIENFLKAKKGKASAHVGRVNTDCSTAEISTIEDVKPKERKVEWSKQERAKAELIKAESMQEMSAKLTAKLTATQQVKLEPDKVEQVKTELAKAKAELAKIKEKMRGEQKEKVKNSAITKEDNAAKNNAPPKLNIDKTEDYLKQDKTVQMHQQKQDLATRNASDQTDRRADDYERLRQKYGFTNLLLANRNNTPVTENISLNDANETQVPDKVEDVNKEKSTEEHSPASRLTTANKEKMEEVGGFKSSEVSECQSKEFKLSSVTCAATNVNKGLNGDTVSDKVKDNSVGKLEKRDPVKVAEVSQQRDSDLAKLLPHERKPKSESNKDQQFVPPRSLSHKERTMTKQEILTSKIKAHAEKEISAIKEKGCALPDGFISKGSSKQLASGQTVTARQRPPSQEVSKKHESSMPSNIKPKPQMEPSGVPVDTVKSLSPTSSAAIPVKSAATITHNIISTAECLPQNQKQEAKPMKNKEQPHVNDQGKQKADHAEISGKPKDGLKDYSAINIDNLKKKEDVSAHTTGAEATGPKLATTENAESKEAANVDLSPLLNVVFGQKKDPAADQSLQIKGIMVTVRERKPAVTAGQGNCSDQHQVNVTEKESSSSDPDKHPPTSGLELSERNISANDIQETENRAKYITKSNSENVQETPSTEAVKNNMRMCQKRMQPQQESSTMNIKPQGETPPETLTEKGALFTVTVSAKNKVPGEIQSLLYKEEIIASERKDHPDKTPRENPASSFRTDEEKIAQKVQTAHTNENFTVTAVDAGINNMNDTDTLIKQVASQTVKEDMTNVVNQFNMCSVDGIRTPRLEENKRDSTTATALNTSPSNKATRNEKTHVSHKRQDNEKLIRECDDDVHIDSIAIRVVPPVTEDSLEKVGKQHGVTLPCDVVQSNEEKQVTSSSCKEKLKTLNTEEEASTKKYSSEDTLGVQHVLSSVRKLSDSLKSSNQQKSNSATSENTQSENEELEKIKKSGELVGKSNEQPSEGEYFQVRGITETSNEPQYNSITDRDASKGRELPGLPPNKTAVSNESHKEGKTEAFVFTLDQSKRKTVESTTLRIQDEDTKRKAEPEDKLASKQRDGSRERWRSNENTEAAQDNHIGKQIEKQSTSSAAESQRSRNSHPARESTVQEKPEVKPKPKGKVSTIPEISAIADYARLKVIVSEDREENTFQEYPPNKKEGFFPLIQTRHSRRPVFTPDPQEFSVKEKSLPNKTEMSAKVNKVPKALVFPITDKEHQRTGMFKLGEKEKQDAKVNEGPVDNATKFTHHKERNDSTKTQTVQMSDSQTVCQEDQSICRPNSHSSEAATSASVVKNSLLHPTTGQTHNRKENMTQQMQDERVQKQQDKDTESDTENGRTDKLKEETHATQHDEIKVKQLGRKQQGGEEQALRCEEKKEDMRKKHILEESRASLAEEERRAAQREEERRAREREAVAIKIKERRDKQRESERRADEERKVKQKEEDIRAKQREEKMRMKETEEKKKINIEKQQRAAQEELQRKVAQEKQQRRAAQEEQQKKAAQEEQQKRAAQEEQQKRAAQEEQQKRAAQEELRRRAAQEQQQKRAVQEEQQRRAAQEEQQRRAAQEEQQKRDAQEEQQRAAQEEQQRRAAQEQQRRVAQEALERRTAQEEQQRRVAQEEQQRKAAQEKQQKRAAQEEQQKRAAQEEQQRRAAQEEQQKRAAQEEQQRAAQEEQQRRAAQEEQQRRAAQEEQQKRAAQEEQQRAAQEEQQRRAAQEQQRRVAQEEQQRRAAQEEQQKRAAQEEQQKRAAQEEQQKRAAQEEQQRAAQEEQQRRAAQEEQQRRAAQEALQRRAAQQRAVQEHQSRTALEELQRRAAEEEQWRTAAQVEQQKKAVQEEQQRVAQEEEQRKAEAQQRRAAQREVQRRAVQEIQQRRRAALIEEQREIEEKILNNTEEEKNRKHREEDKVTHISEKERINQIQIEEQNRQRWENEEWITQKGEAEKRAVEKEKILKEEKQVKERPKLLENSQEALKEEKRVAKEGMLAQRDDGIQANERKEKLPPDTENVRDAQAEQKRAAQVDALQYYAITSTEPEKKPRERQLCSPSPSQQRNNQSEHESPESHMRPSRPHAPASPASSLPRSNTSSPALGAKPLMFRVKDNTFRGSSSTKSVKPRFFKSFGDDYRMGSPNDRGSDKREEEQEKIRHRGGTPVHPDTGLNRLTGESSTFQSASSPQDHSTPIPHYRPYSRRSIAMDEDDARSLISNMSEDVESFTTSAADLAETRGLYDYERPESACSFSSDASRSLGKPPVVPPKSEKALRRAQRLTTRRMKKELSKVAGDSPAGIEKDVSAIRSPSSTEVCSPSRHAMASPHFSSPISLANAPVSGSSLPSSHTEHQSSHYSFHASPHTTGPISIPHSTAAVSLPAVSPYATSPASHAAAPKTVAHVPSSPTLHHANHTAPVTQYHVESSYPQSYPLTQRKVLQDPGSGQYFVVDLPFQVKKKTFFDPQTGKYIQLNVRESGQSILQPQPTQTCPQPQLQAQMQIKPQQQQQPFSQTFPPGKPFLLYQGYHGYPQGYQPASINSLHPNRLPVPAVVHQNQQPGYPAYELGQNCEGHRYSPEKTPYMDTVNDKDKTRNTVYSTHGSYESFPECDTNSQLAGSSVCENDNSAHSQCHPRDIIAMSELEDFMEMSDW